MEAMRRRVALAMLCGFATFVVMLPVACGGLLLFSEHVYGDVDVRGPASLLGGMAMAAVLGSMVAVLVFWKSAGRRPW
jgi:hypothetical protein